MGTTAVFRVSQITSVSTDQMDAKKFSSNEVLKKNEHWQWIGPQNNHINNAPENISHIL